LLDWIANAADGWGAALIAGDFPKLFGNWLTIIGLSIVLIIWAVIAGRRLSDGVGRFSRAFLSALAQLKQTPAAAHAFASSYEKIKTDIGEDPIIGPVWRDWDATLITPTAPNLPVRSTVRPAEYLSIELLDNCGVNPRLHAAMPNLLVGVGLMLTFLGLALALSAAGGIVGADKAMREIGLRDLLGTASAKFTFSLIGLLCSILYTLWRHSLMKKAEQALTAFLAALEERIPLVTAAALQAEANVLLRESADAQQMFSNQLAVSIAGKLDEALDNRLGEHIGPLRTAIETLAAGINTQSQDTMKAMLESFLEQLRGGSGQAMQTVAETLKDLAGSMQEVRAGLADAAGRMAKAADDIANQMSRQADETMARMTQQMEGLVAELRSLAEQSRDSGTEAITQVAKQIAAASEGFTRASADIAKGLDNAMGEMARRMGSEAETAAKTMAAELTKATDALRALSEDSRKTGDTALQTLAQRLADAATAFEASSAKVADVLQGGAGEAASRLTQAMEEMKEQFGRLADELGGSMRAAGEAVAGSSRSGAETLNEAVATAAGALREGGKEAGAFLRQGGAESAEGLVSAARALADTARENAERIVVLQREAAALSASLIAMREAAVDATTPLRGATGTCQRL